MIDTSKLIELDQSITERLAGDEPVNTHKSNGTRRSKQKKKEKDHSLNNVRNAVTKRSYRRLTKKLKKIEGKNYNNAVTIINQNDLHLHTAVKRDTIPKTCLNCKHCVKLFGYCGKYRTEAHRTMLFNKDFDNCVFKEVIK